MVATTWDAANCHPLNFLRNSDLRLLIAQAKLTFAVKPSSFKIWTHNSYNGLWNNGAIGSQNPATNTGGFVPASIGASPYYPACYQQNSPDNDILFNFGANTIEYLPSGFVSVNTAVSATVTLATSFNTSGNITYSEGNLRAKQANSLGYANALCSRATHGLSSTDAAWEAIIMSSSNQSMGWVRSNQAATNYLHELGNSGGTPLDTQYAYNNGGAGGGGTGTVRCAPRTTFATKKGDHGKWFVQFKPVVNAQNLVYGLGNSTLLTTQSPNSANSFARTRSSTLSALTANGVSQSVDALTNGHAEGFYVDWNLGKGWLYCQTTNRYNASGTADPATGIGGFDLASMLSTGLFPIGGCGDDELRSASGYIDLDCGTCPDIPHPSGFVSLDNLGPAVLPYPSRRLRNALIGR